MAWFHQLSAHITALVRGRRQDAELSDEVQHHLDMETEYNVTQGLSPDTARVRAHRAFGKVERYKDDVRDERGATIIRQLHQDVRFGWRSLSRRPAFTALVALTLGLGIGATSALYAVVRTVLLAPLPYRNPEGIAVLWSAWKGFDQTWLSYDEYEAWHSEIKSFADVTIYTDGAVNFTEGDEPERIRSASVQANLFDLLGVRPVLGRGFTGEEDRFHGSPAVILGYNVWQRRFGGDVAILGRAIQIDGQAVPVVGVMPAQFRMPLDFGSGGTTGAYLPLGADAADEGAVPGPAFITGGGNHGFYGIARLSPGATPTSANAELSAYVASLTKHGTYTEGQHFRAFTVSVEDQVTGGVRTAVLVVFGAVGVLLLIACANVAGLLLVRGDRRRRELAVRIALGAEPGRLTRFLLAESALLALLGGGLGVVVAWVGLRVVRLSAPPTLPRIAELHVEPVVLLFTLAVASLAALLFGTLPALQGRRVAPADDLKEGTRGASEAGARLRWRQALVTAEVALAVVLAVGAGLMVRSVANLFAISPGFDPQGVLTMHLSTPASNYGDSLSVVSFWDRLQQRVSQTPGVRSTGAVRLLPLAEEMGDWGLRVEGYTPPPNQGTPADWQVVTPGYFETMGLRRVEGRFLDTRDGLSAPLAMVINRHLKREYFADRPALGSRIWIGGGPDSLAYTVVGIVDDVRHNGLTREVKAQFYATLAQFAVAPGRVRRSMSLVVRTTGNPRLLIAPVRAVIRELDPRLPVSEIRTMDDVLGGSIAAQRFAMQLLAAFGALALLMSAIGVYGVVSQVVAARHQEFGIRAALGASPGQLVALGLRAGLRQTVLGLALGVGAALGATHLMQRLLVGVTPTDPVTFGFVLVMTGGVAILASAWPVRRAAKASPGAILRADA